MLSKVTQSRFAILYGSTFTAADLLWRQWKALRRILICVITLVPMEKFTHSLAIHHLSLGVIIISISEVCKQPMLMILPLHVACCLCPREASEAQQMDIANGVTLVIGKKVHHCGLGSGFYSATQQSGMPHECSLQRHRKANASKADGRTDYVCCFSIAHSEGGVEGGLYYKLICMAHCCMMMYVAHQA